MRASCLPLVFLAACSGFGPPALQPGQLEPQVQAQFGVPTARYPMPGGATRLEFATGPYGRTTWMVDLDASGRVSGWFQALEEPRLHAFQARAPGLSVDELLRTLGRPGDKRGLGWVGGEVWAWRYPTNDCLWYEVSVGSDGKVRDAGFGNDPRCEMNDKGRSAAGL